MNNILAEIKTNQKILAGLLKNSANKSVLNKWLTTELAYTSNAIEGNTLTRRETKLAIEENIASGGKPVTHYMEAVNHAKAYEYIVDAATRNTPLSEGVVLQIHKHILSGIDDTQAGSYRSVRVRISGSQTVLPNPLKVPDLMDAFCDWLAKSDEQPVLKAIEAHLRLVSIHQFVDGNGRTARLLMNFMLLRDKYIPIILRPVDRRRYLMVLENAQTHDKHEEYVMFMLRALNRSLKTAISQLDTSGATENATMTISQFARAAGVPVSTVRYWMRINKIQPISRTDAGYMLFSAEQLKDVK